MKKITLLIIMSLLPFLGFAQQFPENFDGGVFPPTGWLVTDNGVGTGQSWAANNAFPLSAPAAAACFSENIATGTKSQDWLISPQVTIPNNGQLRFWMRQLFTGAQGSTIKIAISQGSRIDLTTYNVVKTIRDDANLDNLIYYEHFADLIPYSNQSVYIAIIREFDKTPANAALSTGGDRILIDDLRLVEKCLDPTGLDAVNVTTAQAQLTWNNTSGATQWDIELVNMTLGQTPNFAAPDYVAVTANNSYLATGLQPDTNYNYYIRAKCTNGFNSEWIGPLSFTTKPLGASCATPLPIAALPYTHSSNTLLYSDAIDGSAGACAPGSYLNGNEVIYQFTADFTGNITLTMTPEAGVNNTGVFIYNGTSCSNIGQNCLAGVANGNNTPRQIVTFPVTNGTPYFVVISSNGTPQSFGYTLVIQKLDCLPPTNLTVSGVSQTGATFGWNIVNAAANWQYVIQPQGTGIPTVAGTTVNPATNSLTVNNLNPSSLYEFYVRSDCGDGTTFSPWVGPLNFNTLCGALPVPFTEGFNQNSTTQFCWSTSNLNSDGNAWNMDYTLNPFEGNQVASIVTSTNTNNDWLISPQLTLTGNQRLRYRYRTETAVNHNFEVRLSTAGTAPTDFTTTLVAQTNYNNTNYLEKIVNMNGVTGNVFIGWHVAPGPNGARLYIDSVIVEDIPPCSNPLDIVVSAIGPNGATVNWTPGFNETSWQVAFVPTGNPAPNTPTAGQTAGPTPTYTTTTLLNPVTTYDVYVLANCGANGNSTWVGPVTFTTTQVPGVVPYIDGFEATPQWSILNGSQLNKWAIGGAVNNGGANALYVTNDNGGSNLYTPTSTSTVHAYRDISIPSGITNLNLAFDWRCEGERSGTTFYDYFNIWLVPTTFVPTVGTQITAGAGRQKVGVNYNMNPIFVTQNVTIPATTLGGQIWRLVFEWRNDGSDGAQPPAAIDNINLTVLNCLPPSNLSATGVTLNSAVLDWTAGGPETAWDIVVQPWCSGVPTASSAIIENQTKPYTASGLSDSTAYEYYVRSDCSGENSYWVGPFVFNTQQVPATLNYTDGFENTNKWTLSNGTQVNKWIVSNAVNNGGTNAMYVSNARCVGNGNVYSPSAASVVHSYRDVTVPAGVDLLSLAFDWRSVGEANDYLRVWTVPATFNPTPGAAITAGAGRTNISGNLIESAAFRSQNYLIPATPFAGQTLRLVFEWRNDGSNGSQTPAAIDNINLAIVTCPPPTNLGVVTTSATSATLTWTAVGTATQWEVYAIPAGGSAPSPTTTGIIVNAIPAQITGLLPGTHYTYYVRSICSTSDVGPWTQTPGNFYTKPINDECADATLVPVNSDIYCDQVTPGTITYATNSNQPIGNACTAANAADDDVWFRFIATNSYLTVSLQDVTGTVAVGDLTYIVYSGGCNGFTAIECVQDGSDVINGLTVGQTYYIRVYSDATTAQTANFNVCITTPSTCLNSSSICTVQPYTYGNTTGVEDLGTIGCLFTSPNPTFFTIQIAQNGPVNLEIVQTSSNGVGLDVDYAAWGPFTSQSLACLNLPNPVTGDYANPINLNPNAGGSSQDYGCSYSTASIEQFIIPNAQAGQIYVLLVTNYEDEPGSITISQTNLDDPNTGHTLCCPGADFAYNPVQYCKGVGANPIPTITQGSIAGFFSCVSSNSADLVFVSTATGEVDLAASQPGTYLIKNDTTGAAGACAGREDYFTIVINAAQSAEISYPDSTPATPESSEFCQSAGPQPVTVTGDQNGFFSLVGQNQIGLSINTDTGQINPSQSQPGTYIVNYYFLGDNECASAPIQTTVIIHASPVSNPVVTQPDCEVPTGTVVLAANSNYEYSVNGGAYGASNIFDNLAPNATYVFEVRDIVNGCVTTVSIIINPLPSPPPTPTATPTAATCTANGSIHVDSPATGRRIYNELFISEVYDKATGSLSFIEVYNGTANPVDLRNYKLRFYTVPTTPNIPTANCDFTLGTPTNFMLAANTTWLVKVSNDPIIGMGVIPQQNATLCAGVNVDDRIELTNLTNVVLDIWGRSDFTPFTPAGQPGYTYRRLNTVNAPSATWNPLDWDALDPESTSDLRNFTPLINNYEYSINGVDFQTSQQFNDVPYSATPYTVTVKDPITKCTATVQVTITNPAPFAAPALSLVTPASCNANPNATVAVTNDMGTGFVYYIDGEVYTGSLAAISLPASATPYVISVVETATGCTTSASITIAAPATVTAPTLNIVDAATCNNSQTATYEITNPAGTGFTYYINGTAYTGSLSAIQLTASATAHTIEVRDDVSGCSAVTSITVNAAPTPAMPTFDLTATIQPTCVVTTGTIVVLTPAQGSGYEYAVNGGTYQASATFTGLAAGATHVVTVRDLTTGCVSASNSITLNAIPVAPVLFATQGCDNGAYTLMVDPNNSDYDYEWTNASGTVISTTNTVVVTEVGQYLITVTTDEGCIATENVTVLNTACDIPKGISPNNDGANDSFDLEGLNVNHLQIINRYGTTVYEHGSGYTNQWHGQSDKGEELPDGTYYYVIESGDGQTRTGWVYINRQR